MIDPDFDDVSATCKGAEKPEGSIPSLGWASIVGLAIAALFAEYIFGWCRFFSPGWANGWPFGVRFQTVISFAMTGWISVISMTASAGAGAIVGFICALLGLGEKNGYRAYRIWLWIAGTAMVCLSIPLFWRIHAWVMEEFPNGYLTP